MERRRRVLDDAISIEEDCPDRIQKMAHQVRAPSAAESTMKPMRPIASSKSSWLSWRSHDQMRKGRATMPARMVTLGV